MARGVNKVILVGNLGNDPEVRHTTGGTTITTLSVATSESWKDKNGEQQERTEWHRCKAFGKLAEICGEYLKKGRQVYIEGSLRTEKYTDKNGVEKYATDIIMDQMQMFGGNPEGGQRRESAAPQQRQEQSSTAGGASGPRGGLPEEDIPFASRDRRWPS